MSFHLIGFVHSVKLLFESIMFGKKCSCCYFMPMPVFKCFNESTPVRISVLPCQLYAKVIVSRREKTVILHMQNKRRRSASR